MLTIHESRKTKSTVYFVTRSTMQKIPLTAAGYAKLDAEIKHLKTVERPANIKALAAAREHGDLSENAEYHAAKEHQSFIESRMIELEDMLSRAQVIDVVKLSGETIKFGATVTLIDEDTNEQCRYQIVGAFEAEVRDGRVSVSSPIARALIGKSIGDAVEVATPSGERFYEVLKVEFI